jgi:uncharacterized Zn-binding protein involved in type VI secretion
MAAAAKVGDLGTPFVTVPIIITGSPDVFINGRPAARKDDITASFQKKQGQKILVLTSTVLASPGVPTVFINGKPVAQIGTPMTNGAKIITGSESVFIG